MIATKDAAWEFEVFYDGDCPLCTREINFLRKRDRDARLRFTDLCDPGFDPRELGKTYDELMAQIHGRLSDGTLVCGVEVFRQLYDRVGFGWLVRLSRLPGIASVLDWAYQVFARNRLRLTGRCTVESCGTTSRVRVSRGV